AVILYQNIAARGQGGERNTSAASSTIALATVRFDIAEVLNRDVAVVRPHQRTGGTTDKAGIIGLATGSNHVIAINRDIAAGAEQRMVRGTAITAEGIA